MAFSWSSATWASLDLVIGVKSSVLVWSSAIGFVIPITYNYTLSILVTLINKLFTTLQAKDGLIAEHTLQRLLLTKQRKLITNWKTTKQSTQLHMCATSFWPISCFFRVTLKYFGCYLKKKKKKRIVLQVHLYKLLQRHFGFKMDICKRTMKSCCETTFWVLKMHFQIPKSHPNRPFIWQAPIQR